MLFHHHHHHHHHHRRRRRRRRRRHHHHHHQEHHQEHHGARYGCSVLKGLQQEIARLNALLVRTPDTTARHEICNKVVDLSLWPAGTAAAASTSSVVVMALKQRLNFVCLSLHLLLPRERRVRLSRSTMV